MQEFLLISIMFIFIITFYLFIVIRFLVISRYARAYSGIQFFDPNLFLPPPFTFLSMLVLLVQYIDDSMRNYARGKGERNDNGELKGGRDLGLEDRNGGNTLVILMTLSCFISFYYKKPTNVRNNKDFFCF